MRLFETAADYAAFFETMVEARQRIALAFFAYCLMPTHFHFVVEPSQDDQLSQFMRFLTGTHSKRWNAFRGSTGTGAVYQGRYKAFPIQTDRHFLTVCRYVERNPIRAGLASRAESWPWSSLGASGNNCVLLPLKRWPVLRPENWTDFVNEPLTAAELEAVRTSVRRNRPFGDGTWVERAATELRLEPSLEPFGRRLGAPGVVVKDL